MEQQIRFVDTRFGQIAYATAGSGPPLLCDLGWLTHLHANWEATPYRRFYEALGAHFTVIRFDRPGTGLSDRVRTDFSVAPELAAMDAIVDDLRLETLSVFGACAPVAALFAAQRPAAVRQLVLYGSYARGSELAPSDVQASLAALMRSAWGLGSRLLADIFVVNESPDERRWFSSLQRQSSDGDTAARLLGQIYSTDAGPALSSLRVPTLVMHRVDDRAIKFEHGRRAASMIPGARFQPLPGASHIAFFGDTSPMLDAALDFLRTQPAAQVLTGRELEVADLVAAGLTNAQIGRRLGIATRTADAHVEHIRTKLQVRSRAQIASWATERALWAAG